MMRHGWSHIAQSKVEASVGLTSLAPGSSASTLSGRHVAARAESRWPGSTAGDSASVGRGEAVVKQHHVITGTRNLQSGQRGSGANYNL